MAGAGLITIRRRMKSVTNTLKITKAMGLVATSKLRKVRVSLNSAEIFSKRYASIFEAVRNAYAESSVFVTGNKSSKKLYIVITSESGLCGGYNASVVNKVSEITGNDKADSLILVVGQKGRGYFNRLKYETAAEYVEVSDVPSLKETNEIFSKAISLYLNGEVGEVNIVFTKFISSVKQVITVDKLLPIEKNEKGTVEDFVFEPSIESIFDYAVKENIKNKIYYALTSAKASEHSSRMTAMDNASENANDILDKLALKYNRIRQFSITQEITEIVGGAEAQR
ncbi:ATP synthase F1 subunit gamma [Clostridium oryzae]|uniref:ATP synthase gamma chain n=1 Tax=Clostridium oryzae TaxID=1450648 RepID=A0A1V4ITR1_9CLOT|nr:ATP synthase F1 subunit gamma [Clostridium oryzae]OPJ63428.1 ATP synthase gamma chain [Clostridium oryzae]